MENPFHLFKLLESEQKGDNFFPIKNVKHTFLKRNKQLGSAWLNFYKHKLYMVTFKFFKFYFRILRAFDNVMLICGSNYLLLHEKVNFKIRDNLQGCKAWKGHIY